MNVVRWFGILVLLAGCSRPDNYKDEQQLQSLLDQKEYFRLRASLNQLGDRISNERKIYFRAFVENAFNQDKKSEEDVDSLFNQYSSTLVDSTKISLLRLQDKNYFRTFDYSKAANTDQEILNRYSHTLDSSAKKDIQNDLLIRKALTGIPPQQLSQTRSTTIPWTRDKIGLIEIPVNCHNTTYPCIFDTRANISSITRTFAAKLGLKILNVSYEEGSGITGIRFKTGMGIADSLYIGGILLQHVVFQVMPDEILYLSPVHFSLNIILGFPVIEQLKEVHIFRDGRMTIPSNPSRSDLNNLALDGLDPIVYLRTGSGDTLSFYFDTGATGSNLFSTYFTKYRQKITREAKLEMAQNGGAGGIVETKVYTLDSISLYIGDKKVNLKQVNVLTNPIANMKEKFYGNIGQDFVSQTSELILNFEEMYIDFK